MKETRETGGAASAIEQRLLDAPARVQAEEGGMPGLGELANGLSELVRSGRLPEGFDLQEACADAGFLTLVEELPLEAAARVYAAEQRAAQAGARAREELAQQMQRRTALPQAIRGAGGPAVERDYAGMSSEEFRALEQQYRRAAQRGIHVRL